MRAGAPTPPALSCKFQLLHVVRAASNSKEFNTCATFGNSPRNVMKTSYSMFKRPLSIAAIAVAGALTCSSAFADPEGGVPSAGEDNTPSMSTLRSLDRFTGGYKGWGPMANPHVPSSSNESMPARYAEDVREQKQQLAEVAEVHERVWVANAPLRAPYELENIGATKAAAARGEYRYDSNQAR